MTDCLTFDLPDNYGRVLYFHLNKGLIYEKTAQGTRQALCSAWSGCSRYRNRATFAHVAGKGPIPPGRYSIGAAIDHTKLGPVTFPLWPLTGTQTYGRVGFWLHGGRLLRHDSGCVVVADIRVRRAISKRISSALPWLLVVLDDPPF